MKRYLSILILSCLAQIAIGQSSVAYYPLDCSLKDSTKSYLDIQASATPSCVCGVSGDGMEFVANENYALDSTISSIFKGKFAISLYFRSMPSAGSSQSQELFSLGNNCSSDSLMRLFYLEDMNEVIFEISESVQESTTIRAKLEGNKCWNHVIVSRDNNSFYLYLNGELAATETRNSEIVLSKQHPLIIGNGPCVGVISKPFNGYIDELKIFNQHIEAFRAKELNIPIDVVLHNDTTLYIGDKIDVNTTEQCDPQISWTPSTGLDNSNSSMVQITAEENIKYTVEFDYGNCIGRDTLNIYVVDPNEVQCDELLIPNAFTPNGDGLNDEFGILNSYIIEEFKFFEIYDRWGAKVFTTTNKDEKWDGSHKSALNSGLYVYKVVYTCRGKELVKTGHVSILR